MATSTVSALAAGRPLERPGVRLVANEALAGLDAARLVRRLPRLVVRRRGATPRDVLVLPGWLASDASTVLLRAVLTRDGHRVRGWDRGRNRGDVEEHIDAVLAVVRRRAETTRAPLDLVGQSLGGVIAREVARRAPDAVRRVVTLGTPLHGAAGTVFEPWFAPGRSSAVPPPVPTTVIWSRRDGIVGWGAQLDHDNPWAEHVEVTSRHLGMGLDPAVLTVVRDRVAEPVGPAFRAATTTLGADRR